MRCYLLFNVKKSYLDSFSDFSGIHTKAYEDFRKISLSVGVIEHVDQTWVSVEVWEIEADNCVETFKNENYEFLKVLEENQINQESVL